MYASIRDSSLLGAGYRSIADGAKALGLSGVEMDFSRQCAVRSPTQAGESFRLTSEEARQQFRAELDEAGIHVSALLLGNDFNAEDLKSEVAWCVSAVDAAGALGIKAVRIDSAMRGGNELDLDTCVERFKRGVTQVLEATEASGVPLGIENHGAIGNQREFLDAVLDGVNSPRLGMTLDTGNFYWYGYPIGEVYEILEHFAPHTKHTHIKNINYPVDTRQQRREVGWKYREYVCPIPDGDLDVARIVGFLKDAGYEGDICIEDESLGRLGEAERREVLQSDVDFLKGVIEG